MIKRKKKSLEEIIKLKEDVDKRNIFFLSIWNKRPHHLCFNCGIYLGKKPLSYMFDHILEKSKYPNLEYEEDNICYLCLNCHDNKTRANLSVKLQELRDVTIAKFINE